MKLLRFALSAVGTLLLVAGFLASLSHAMEGRAAEYAARVDQPAIVQLSLLLFLAAIGLLFVPDREPPSDQEETG